MQNSEHSYSEKKCNWQNIEKIKTLHGGASDDILWATDLDFQLWWPITIS